MDHPGLFALFCLWSQLSQSCLMIALVREEMLCVWLWVASTVMLSSKCKKKVCNVRAWGLWCLRDGQGKERDTQCPGISGATLSVRFFCVSFPASCVLHSSLVFPGPGCPHSQHAFQTKARIFVYTVYLKGMGSDWSTVVRSPHLWLRKWNPMQHRGWKHICCNHCKGKKWLQNSVHHC